MLVCLYCCICNIFYILYWKIFNWIFIFVWKKKFLKYREVSSYEKYLKKFCLKIKLESNVMVVNVF